MEAFSWICPFCNRPATITENSIHSGSARLTLENKHGAKFLFAKFIVCPHPKCKEYTLSAMMFNTVWYERSREWILESQIKEWDLIPPSHAKVFPDYVPEAIRNDYAEACLIKDLSPKASATLARRCLQGMVRDFLKVKGKNLKAEIEKIKDKVDPLTWKAIDAVRSVGNIGAHMEKNIDLIIDVAPEEAGLLIGLIERLIKEWYVNRHERETSLLEILEMKKEKDSKRKADKEVQESPTEETGVSSPAENP